MSKPTARTPETGLESVLKAEARRALRTQDATQLLFLRLATEKIGPQDGARALLHSLAEPCDSVCLFDRTWAVLVLPGLSRPLALDLADEVARRAQSPMTLALCSVPQLFLLEQGAAGLVRFLKAGLARLHPAPRATVLALPGLVREDEARVSVEEKNFLFA